MSPYQPKRSRGFTLLEILVSMLILGIISLAFIRMFSTTLDAAGRIADSNQLLQEAQVAERIMAARIKLAWKVFPPGTSIKINNGATTYNYLAGSDTCVVGTDPMLAMILPPRKPENYQQCSATNPDACFRFFAYYSFRRSDYLSAVAPGSAEALFPDSKNDSTWVIMEYRRTLTNTNDPSTITPPNGEAIYTGTKGRLLIEYVQPQDASPTYTLFTISPDSSVEVQLRMLMNTSKRTYRAPPKTDAPLTIRAVPRNLGVGGK